MSSAVNKGSGWNFSLEDTTDKCYRDISNELSNHGWNRVSYKKRSKLERKRLPMRDRVDVIWTLNEKDIDFAELSMEQGCNHFENITSLTTKRGFCDLLREVHWNSHDSFDIAPRCYNLGDPIHREEFIDDFRLTAATNILKWYVLRVQHNQSWCRSCTPRNASATLSKNAAISGTARATSSSSWRNSIRAPLTQMILPPAPTCDGTSVCTDAEMLSVMQDALTACVWHLRVSKYGEWPEVDLSRYFKGRETPLEESQWAKLLDFSYDIAALRCDPQLTDLHDCFDIGNFKSECQDAEVACSSRKTATRVDSAAQPSMKDQPHFDAYLYKIKSILHGMTVTLPQTRHIDGMKNIWVIKAPDSSCGVGIKLHARLDDILQSERGMGGRTVQKYLESPLLVPLAAYVPLDTTNALQQEHLFSRLTPPPLPLRTPLTKFDMRVWVLVTSFQPLTAYIYSTLYGRRCSTAYDLNVDTLHDSYTHLTNYSVQKKQKLNASGSSANIRRSSTDRGVNSSDNSDQEEPDLSTSSFAASSRVDLNANVNASHKADTSVTRKLRSAVGSARNQASNSSAATGAQPQSEHVPVKRLSEADLLVSHEEIVTTVQRQYLQYLHGTSALAASVVKRIGRVDDVWSEYLWPLIRHKILCTLQGACESVVHRPRSFEFLGYDVILDASLQPWVLEVNMSPAMAHRSPQQSKLIETMTQGLLDLAVYPHFGGSVPIEHHAGGEGNAQEKSEPAGLYGQWKTLTPSMGTSTGPTTTASNKDMPVATLETPEEDPPVVLGDWDEIIPPPGTFTKPSGSNKPRRPSSGSALHRKYAHVQNNSSSEAQCDAYFQKFVTAAAEQANRGGVYVSTGVDGVSAGAAGNSATSGVNFVANVSNLMAVGNAVNTSTMETIDSLCSGFGQVLHLQKWWRKRLAGLRSWHQRRRESGIKIQCAYRQHRARRKLRNLWNQRAALCIQCFVRRQQARGLVTLTRCTLAATRVQCLYRGVQGRKRFVMVLRLTKQRQIQKWFWYHVARKKIRASTLIVLRVRAWLQKRKHSAILIAHALKTNFVARRRRAAKLSRIFYDWLASYKFAYNYRLENIRILAASAAEKAQTLSAKRRHSLDQSIQQREWQLMNEEDRFMQELVLREEGVEVVQEVFDEVLDRAWAVVRKRRLSQQRMSRAAPHANSHHKHVASVVADGNDDASNMHLSAAARRQQAEIRAEQKSKIKFEEIGPEVHNEEFLTRQFVQKKKASNGGLRRTAHEEEQHSHLQAGSAIPDSATEVYQQASSKPFQHVDDFQFDADAILQALINTTSNALAASFSSSSAAVTVDTGRAGADADYQFSRSDQRKHMKEAHESLPDPSQLRTMIDAAAAAAAAAAPGHFTSPHTPPRAHAMRPRTPSQGQPFAYYEAHQNNHQKNLHAQYASAVEEEVQWHTKEKRNSFRNRDSERQSVAQPSQQEVTTESFHPSRRERRAPITAGAKAESVISTSEQSEGDEVRPASGSAFLFSSALSGHSLKVRDTPNNSTKNYPSGETSLSDEPLRRSLDTGTATQRPTKQKVVEQNQVDNKNWFSYDGGSSTRLDSNEAWFLALQRKQAEKSQQFNGTAHELPMRKTRPQSGSAIRSSTGATSRDGNQKPYFIPHAPATPLSDSAQSSPNSQSHRKYPVYSHDLLEPHVNPALTIGRAPSPPAGFYYTQHTDSSSGKVRPTSAGARYSASVLHPSTHGGGNVAGGAGHHQRASSRPARATRGDFLHTAQPPVDPGHFGGRQANPQARGMYGHKTFHVPATQPAKEEYYSHTPACNIAPWDYNIYNSVAPSSTSGKYQFDRTPAEAPRSKKTHASSSATSKKDRKRVKERIAATYMG